MLLILIIVGCAGPAVAEPSPTPQPDWRSTAHSIINVLGYVAIDYPKAVRMGAIVNTAEYAEQREFLATVNELVEGLPDRAEQQSLISRAQDLALLVDRRAPSEDVASGARKLIADLIEAYGVITSPKDLADPASVTALYADQCAGCHGDSGRGDGPAGKTLVPAPTNFHDVARAKERSLYSLYSTVTLGVAGTGMPSFSSLDERERWALAFYVAGLRDDPEVIAQGQRLWNGGQMHEIFPTLESFTSRSPATIDSSREVADSVLAYLRHHPEVLPTTSADPVQHTIAELRNMLSAYGNANEDDALQLALSAYLDGYELIEAPLRTLDGDLAIGIERDMQALRKNIRDGVPPDELEKNVVGLEVRLREAATLLSTSGSATSTLLLSAFLILLREGLEAILLLAAMSLYLRRTEQSAGLRYLHFGWLSALAAGAVTWFGVKTVISISGAQREVVEGLAALLAAFVLLYVGIWIHRHSTAAHWQAYLNQQLGRTLAKGALWGIAGLAFIAVFREILETILFYEILWRQSGSAMPLFIGASLASIALIAVVWTVFRIGARLPLRRFFQANAVLMFILALIFTGKGVSALQEAGWIGVTFIGFPRIDWLGIYPTLQSVGAQLLCIFAAALWLALQACRTTNSMRHGAQGLY